MLKSFGLITLVLAVAASLAYWGSDTLAARFLALTFFLYALISTVHLNALHKWAALREKRDLPQGLGFWAPVFSRLRKAHRSDAESKSEIRVEFDRIQAVVDQVPDGLVVLDQYDHIIRQPDFFAYLASTIPLPPLKTSIATRPGRLFELRAIASGNGQKLLISRDITEASKIDVMRRDFVANVSHEIRTPVTVIGGFAETLLSIDVDKESHDSYLQTILKQSQTMQRLLEDLLTLSSLESGTDVAGQELVDMPSLIESLASEAKSLSKGRHEISCKIDGPSKILGAQTEIETAARNLIVNALRYTPDGGKVEISWQGLSPFESLTSASSSGQTAFPSANQAWLRVKDTGPGIPAEHIPRLTERFYRVDRARSRDTGGTGLGLAIVKHVAQRHQAELVIESELSKGSRFSIGFNEARIARETA
jgi:two-component system, OmpR family, phosphate regulon sensor histidine kinase PhoR